MYSTTHSYPGGVYQILPLTKGKEFHRQFKYVFLPIVLWYHSNLKLKVRFRIYRDKLLDEAIQHKVIEWKRNGCTFVDLDGAKAINVVLNLRIFIKGQTGLMWYRKHGLSDSNVVEGVHFPDFETVGDDKSFPANGVPLWLPDIIHDESFGEDCKSLRRRIIKENLNNHTKKTRLSKRYVSQLRNWYNGRVLGSDKCKFRSNAGSYVSGALYSFLPSDVHIIDYERSGDTDLVFNLLDPIDSESTTTVNVRKALSNDKFFPVLGAALHSLKDIAGKIKLSNMLV